MTQGAGGIRSQSSRYAEPTGCVWKAIGDTDFEGGRRGSRPA
jgi:hypothetical protein